MGRTGLSDCFARLGEPVRVSATIPLATALRLDALAPRLGLSRSAAIAEAVSVRTFVWERQVERRRRHAIEQLLRQADSWAPIDELLAEARRLGQID